jgi:hypothetical protein
MFVIRYSGENELKQKHYAQNPSKYVYNAAKKNSK